MSFNLLVAEAGLEPRPSEPQVCVLVCLLHIYIWVHGKGQFSCFARACEKEGFSDVSLKPSGLRRGQMLWGWTVKNENTKMPYFSFLPGRMQNNNTLPSGSFFRLQEDNTFIPLSLSGQFSVNVLKTCTHSPEDLHCTRLWICLICLLSDFMLICVSVYPLSLG